MDAQLRNETMDVQGYVWVNRFTGAYATTLARPGQYSSPVGTIDATGRFVKVARYSTPFGIVSSLRK